MVPGLAPLLRGPISWVFGGILSFLQAWCRAVELFVVLLCFFPGFSYSGNVLSLKCSPNPRGEPCREALRVVLRELVRIRGSPRRRGQRGEAG